MSRASQPPKQQAATIEQVPIVDEDKGGSIASVVPMSLLPIIPRTSNLVAGSRWAVGLKVWPDGAPETFCTDHWRCRFIVDDAAPPLEQAKIFALLARVGELGYDVIKTEHLYTFDGEPGFSLGEGQ